MTSRPHDSEGPLSLMAQELGLDPGDITTLEE